jgi:hypothetical protein
LIEAELILGLCDRFHCLPQQVEEMDASVIRMLKVYDEGTAQDDGE